jgi:hypothetical protein
MRGSRRLDLDPFLSTAAMAAAWLADVGRRFEHGEEAVEHESGTLDEGEQRSAHEHRASSHDPFMRTAWAPSTCCSPLGELRGTLEEVEDGAPHCAFPNTLPPYPSPPVRSWACTSPLLLRRFSGDGDGR